MTEKEVTRLLTFIANNLEVKSGFLTPTPKANIDVVNLIDEIADIQGVEKEVLGIEFNNIMDKIENYGN
tara:strand:- start:6888 stop:7094 length:207 start_codon:yes stop_codon:yes gene_type:complete